MKYVVILQARTTSTRLPAKALLPIAGYPSVSLAALRAANAGGEVIVATSDDPSDDALAAEVQTHQMRVVRGSLHDLLARFHRATDSLSDSDIVVRLTADNVVPDGRLVQDLASALHDSDMEYLFQASPQSRLPYGLGGEAFRVRTLRKAHLSATSAFDREHVGPWMQRNCRSAIHTPSALQNADFSHLRCTIDDQQDYDRICRLFCGIAEPVQATWWDLLMRLAALPDEPRFRIPYRVVSGRAVGQMTLGTAQLGLEYGVANRTGKPNRETATGMVRDAIAHGVSTLDTARAYGDAEEVLGQSLTGAWRSRAEVITKLDPLASLSARANRAIVEAAVDASIQQSCEALGANRLNTVLLHRWQHHDAWEGAAWRRLLALRDRGTIGALGASLNTPTEALQALKDPDIKSLQIPFNLLDQRWRSKEIRQALAARPDVVVSARSVFLQGVLLSDAANWPSAGNYDANAYVRTLQQFTKRFERQSVADLCVAYVRAQDWICSLVVGCETPDQLKRNLEIFCLPPLKREQCAELEERVPEAPESLLNPSQWNNEVYDDIKG